MAQTFSRIVTGRQGSTTAARTVSIVARMVAKSTPFDIFYRDIYVQQYFTDIFGYLKDAWFIVRCQQWKSLGVWGLEGWASTAGWGSILYPSANWSYPKMRTKVACAIGSLLTETTSQVNGATYVGEPRGLTAMNFGMPFASEHQFQATYWTPKPGGPFGFRAAKFTEGVVQNKAYTLGPFTPGGIQYAHSNKPAGW